MDGDAPRVESSRKASAAQDRDPGAGELRQARTRRSAVAVQSESAIAAAATERGLKKRRREMRRRADGSEAPSATSDGRRSVETRGDRRSSAWREADAWVSERIC
jgi:hypothetical protein